MTVGTSRGAAHGLLDWYLPTGRRRRGELWLGYVLVLVLRYGHPRS
jgi:hypothetical protein